MDGGRTPVESSTPANNVTMEPYRAFVSDRLDASQHSIGFLTQSAFTGLGQTLSYLTPSILRVPRHQPRPDHRARHPADHDDRVPHWVSCVDQLDLVDGDDDEGAPTHRGRACAHRGASARVRRS
jgi:hypothetical protein